MKAWLPVGLAVCLVVVVPGALASGVALIRIDGAIGPATAEFVERAVSDAGRAGDSCLIIQLDTPGGLLDSTKRMVQSIYAAPLPVVVYVAPAGASAGSAGCFITMAGHVAAMAPNTTIGAAHPVAIGGTGGGEDEKPDDTMNKKMENFATSFIESIAERRHRNVAWARSAVMESASITAEEALKLNVIDVIAEDVPALLAKIDGRVIEGATLATARATVREIPMLLRERVFQLIGRPEVMFVLMLIAVYGIIGELSNPGAIVPGAIGGVSLIIVLYLGAILPVSAAGVALLVLAIGLFVGEALTPTFGAFTAGGLVAFIFGALMLFDTVAPSFRLSWTLIASAAVLTAAFFVLVVGAGLRAQWLPVKSGREFMIGRAGVAITDIDPIAGGRVVFDGEDWRAVSDAPVASGRRVEVTRVKGLVLSVKPGLEGEETKS